ncbi:peptidoglycan-binding domain-containing protein [Streptomyces indicus]|uniref:Putative peptidoglycan binding domain-containing protein n=1 Tax=Streptomyces indicus TaxID=417292 RepID=A0A1G9EB40_9ACTN|nr:peptidoglycan-binding domain-containing protein [Streptomyces indicus]SDK73298.1 Putative peptidoglycan binding domain-containing protein [Streptomyces indicus]
MTKWTTPAATLLATGMLALGLTACGGGDAGTKTADKSKTSAGKKGLSNKAGAGSGSSGGAAGSGQPKPIRKGDTGTKVKCVQRAVNAFNRPQIVADGVFGTGTEKAVKLFQDNNGLSKDGIVGAKTGARMELLMEKGKRENLDNPAAFKRYATWLDECKSRIPD